ncbi:MAG: TPM domain-containing protein [Paracoccus sp. (in: a-proteobacteria)]|uniref:TPM domain-containing protein n=1 Tax=Paracoccus sp. TaxID=267 RepID=UPI0026DFF99B|nr:TPM domain-containing protein [Paracoccus sp. (in: a-proteobacteria)]MDO5613545.1 TPM domain-containing protein [Paracoccus sp. (in: a-proteobacteria)]
MIRAAILWVALSLPVAAQGLPDWQHTSINDFAAVLSAEDTQILDQALIALHDGTGVQGTVVTLSDRARYGGSDGLEPFATRLFNHWGVGDAERNDGFMVLLLTDDREVRIELGAGYPAAADRVAGQIIDDTMLPDFRAGNMSRGVREGTLDVIQRIARPHAAGEQVAPSRDGLGWLIPAGVFAFFGFVIVQIGRGLIGNLLRARQPCPQCGGAGLMQESETVGDALPGGTPTTRRVIWRRCTRCGWTSPRETRSSPVSSPRPRRSRGGGFGGGRSSGGGASGRW